MARTTHRRHHNARPARRRHYNAFGAFMRRHHRRRRHNPHRRINLHYRRRRHNPLALPGREIIPIVGWAIVGGIATRALPESFLSSSNTGFMGYIYNGAVAFLGSMALGKFAGPNAGKGWLIGGLVQTVGRIVSDFWGKTLVTFGNPLSGLSGDPAYRLGAYEPSGNFYLPTTSDTMALTPGVAAPMALAPMPGPLGPFTGGVSLVQIGRAHV